MIQHLRLCHPQPIHCVRCFRRFAKQDHLSEHSRKNDPCGVVEPQAVEGVTYDQLTLLEQRRPGKMREEKWCIVYETLFPELSSQPKDPFLPSRLANDLAALRDFVNREVPDLLIERIQASSLLQCWKKEIPWLSRFIFGDVVDSLSVLSTYSESLPSTLGF